MLFCRVERDLFNHHIDYRQGGNLGEAIGFLQVDAFRYGPKEYPSHTLVCLAVAKLSFERNFPSPLRNVYAIEKVLISFGRDGIVPGERGDYPRGDGKMEILTHPIRVQDAGIFSKMAFGVDGTNKVLDKSYRYV